ncbi:MAG: 50S ribosomal protein L18 [Firmicutes bacterium]|nr:50S ribosomal protein L18 [Bacillota bacterium]
MALGGIGCFLEDKWLSEVRVDLGRLSRQESRRRRQLRVRSKVVGSAERPRLSVFRSLKHIYAQVVDDEQGRTLVSACSLDPEMREAETHGGNVETARLVGKAIAKRALDKGIKRVVFDRGGNIYHGRVRALAESARAEGLEF